MRARISSRAVSDRSATRSAASSGRHLLEDVGGAGRLEVLEHLDLRLGLHLLDRVGHRLVVERGQDAGPVARRELVDDRGQVGRVQLGQARVGHAQLDRGDRRLDRVDVLPVDVPLGHREPQVAGERAGRPFDAQPAEQARAADVDRHEVERPADLVEAEVVDPDDLAPVDVDDLLVHEVGAAGGSRSAAAGTCRCRSSPCAAWRRSCRATRPRSRARRCGAGRS